MTKVEDFSADFESISPELLTRAKRIYESHGILVAKRFFTESETQSVKSYIARLIELRRAAIGMPPQKVIQFDDGLMDIVAANRADAGPIYDACRRLMPVHQLMDSPKIVALSRLLMKTQYVISYPERMVRMDLPGESKYLFDWHQDFHYAGFSPDALVYWSPLHKVTAQNGALLAAPGSHKLGNLPVHHLPERANEAGKSRSYTYELADKTIVDRFEHTLVEAEEGDLVVFSMFLLHRSGENHSQRARWTMQARHGNFDQDSQGITLGKTNERNAYQPA